MFATVGGQLSEVATEFAGPRLGSPAVSSDQRWDSDGGQPSEPHTDPMLPAITDDMLPPLNTPPVPTLDDRALAEMLAELEGEDAALLDSADGLGTSSAEVAGSVGEGADGSEAGAQSGSATVVIAPSDAADAGPDGVDGPPERAGAGPDGVDGPPPPNIGPTASEPVPPLPSGALPSGAVVASRPGPLIPHTAPIRRSVGERDRRTEEDRGRPAAAPVRRTSQEQVAAPLAPLTRFDYGDFRPPVSRLVEEPSLTGLTRRSRGRFGSVLFTIAFVVIFLLIVTQALLSLLDAGAGF